MASCIHLPNTNTIKTLFMKKCIFLLSFYLFTGITYGQNWEIGVGLHALNYQGDLVESSVFTLKETNPNFGLFLRRTFKDDKFAVRLNGTFGKISGDDTNFDKPAWRQTRKFNFSSSLTEIAGLLEWSPLSFDKVNGAKRKVVPYLFAGVGVVMTNPTVNFNEANNPSHNATQVAKDKADLVKTALAIPLGAGIKLPLGPGFLALEGGIRPTTSDYLDGISQTGNPDRNDWYVSGGISYAYRFGSGGADTDGDGIVDKKDKCPEVPGLKQNMGCPGDRDNDGIYDSDDRCADVAGDASNLGCPVIAEADREVISNAISNINFKTGSAVLENASFAVLDKVADVLRRYPYYQCSIEGHTDDVGEEATNLLLSQNRAKACHDYLLRRGIKPVQMKHAGFGETRPLGGNDTEEGRRQNRRVDFVLTVN
jgi:outer membrane protein OmpA-like peptidoglycan-associated protein